jgi:hypothetical protein
MSIEALETRVVRLEVTTDNHAEDIKELRKSSVDLTKALGAIEKTLAQIKYIAVGALAVVIAQSVGIDKAFKFLFGG